MIIRDVVLTTLKQFGYKFQINGESVEFVAVTRDEPMMAEFIINEEARFLRLFIYANRLALYPTRDAAFAIAARVNKEIVLGGLVANLDNGEFAYRASMDFRHLYPYPALISDMMNGSSYALKLFTTAYDLLVDNMSASPKDIVSAALIQTGGAGTEDFTDEAKKLLLTVESGGSEDLLADEEDPRTPKLRII
jgi:hypothetical protein